MGKTELKIEIDADLAAQAEASGLDLAHVLEAELRHKLKPSDGNERARRWAEENAGAIAEYNQHVREHGLFGDEFRKW